MYITPTGLARFVMVSFVVAGILALPCLHNRVPACPIHDFDENADG